ncbi:hypothetical protein CBFG_05378 [Clostridiales bacterium 1_7_47FAA]|nr:hypothetical protein CBFG_05378 [Clostridiales bacterium 1_7_47FAA]
MGEIAWGSSGSWRRLAFSYWIFYVILIVNGRGIRVILVLFFALC